MRNKIQLQFYGSTQLKLREIKKQTKVEKKVTRWTVKNEAASVGDSAAQIAEGPEAGE